MCYVSSLLSLIEIHIGLSLCEFESSFLISQSQNRKLEVSLIQTFVKTEHRAFLSATVRFRLVSYGTTNNEIKSWAISCTVVFRSVHHRHQRMNGLWAWGYDIVDRTTRRISCWIWQLQESWQMTLGWYRVLLTAAESYAFAFDL